MSQRELELAAQLKATQAELDAARARGAADKGLQRLPQLKPDVPLCSESVRARSGPGGTL